MTKLQILQKIARNCKNYKNSLNGHYFFKIALNNTQKTRWSSQENSHKYRLIMNYRKTEK